MNKVILIGYIANDPETRTTQSGVAQCSFRMGVQRRFANAQGQRENDFFSVVCFRQTAEFAGKYLSKGRKVAVEGSLQTRSYDAQDGTKRYVTEVIADNVEFCDSKQESGKSDTAHAAGDVAQQAAAVFGMTVIEDDDLPF